MIRSDVAAIAGAALLLVVTVPRESAAQYVPQPGTGAFTVGYQFSHAKYHLLSVREVVFPNQDAGSNRVDFGPMEAQTTDFGASYCPVRGLNASVNARYIAARYLGPFLEHPTDTPHYRGSFQDATLGLTYDAAWNGFVIAPSLAYSFPLADYVTMGHTSVGRGVDDWGVGLALTRDLDPILPNASLTASVSRDLRPKVQIWNIDATSYELGASYLVTESLALGGHFTYSEAKGGFDWADNYNWAQPDAMSYHDQAAAYVVRTAGGAVNYRFNSTYSLGLEVSGVLSGANTTDPVSYSISTGYNFFWMPFTH